MAHPSLGQLAADAWEHTLRTTEGPSWWRGPRPSYRERLDAVKLNYFGEPIPRIEIVRHNLRQLKAGNTLVWRGLDVKDRRQGKDRRGQRRVLYR